MTISDKLSLQGCIARSLSFLRKRRRIAPDWREVGSFGELLDARRPSILWLHEPKPLPPALDLLFPEHSTEEMRRRHSTQGLEPGRIGLASLSDAVVSGPSLVGSLSSIFLLAPMMPLFCDEYLERRDPVGDLKLTKKRRRDIDGTSILVTYWASFIYGHWLLESMPKLLLLRRVAHELPPLRFVLPKSLPGWVSRWIELILPDAAIEMYDDAVEYVRCERLLLPTMLLSAEHVPHPELATLLDDLREIVPRTNAGPRRIFVSRVEPNPNAFRDLVNAEGLERIAVEEGLTVVTPEKLSVAEQIALFAGAELIVGEFGSGMHNALFSPAGARVLCLNWINPLQSWIAQLKRQSVGYLLPSDGAPVTYVLGSPRREYRIDPDAFRACLRRLLAE